MRILVLSWEYPPAVHGGLGRHVGSLSEALAELGHEVTVVAPGTGLPAGGPVRVLHPDPADPVVPLSLGDLHGHVATLGAALARTAVARGRAAAAEGRPFDVLCAHDWVVAQAAASVQAALDLPLVVTLHATEAGRHQGWLPGELSRSIHATEGWVAGRAARVLVCSKAMRRDVQRLFAVPDERVQVVPNGIDTGAWPTGPRAREREPLAVFAGRLEYEKGPQVLLRAAGRLRRRVPGVRIVVAGTGTFEGELRALARELRLGRAVEFTGRLGDADLGALYRRAAVVAVPSIYEPFGLVALEAAASGAPLVVADTGGLAEFADGGRTASLVPPDDAGALADAVTSLLQDRDAAEKLAAAAQASAKNHDWAAVAVRTAAVYAAVPAEQRPRAVPGPAPAEGVNLLR